MADEQQLLQKKIEVPLYGIEDELVAEMNSVTQKY
jgi:hypothetical protein